MAIAPALLVRVLAEGLLAFLLDHCQVGFAVMSIIWDFLFLCLDEKARKRVQGVGLWLGSTMKIIYLRNPPRFGPEVGAMMLYRLGLTDQRSCAEKANQKSIAMGKLPMYYLINLMIC